MIKQKDNLTDVVEHLPKVPAATTPQSGSGQQVLNPMGELVTLGQNEDKKEVKNIKASSIELPIQQIKQAITNALDNFSDRQRGK